MTHIFKFFLIVVALHTSHSYLYLRDSRHIEKDCNLVLPTDTHNHRCGTAIATLLQHFIGIWHDNSFSSLSRSVLANARVEGILGNCSILLEYVSTSLVNLNTRFLGSSSSANYGSKTIGLEKDLACLYDVVISKFCHAQKIVCEMFDMYVATLQQSKHEVFAIHSFTFSKENVAPAHNLKLPKLITESEMLGVITLTNTTEQLQKLHQLFEIISDNTSELNVDMIKFDYLINNILPNISKIPRNDIVFETIQHKSNERMQIFVNFLLTNIESNSVSEFMLDYNSENASVLLKNAFMPVIKNVIRRCADNKSSYVAKITKFISYLKYDEHLIIAIQFLSYQNSLFSENVAIAEKFRYSEKLIRFKEHFPEIIQSLVWGSMCYLKESRYGDFLLTRESYKLEDSIYRVVYFENSQSLESQWNVVPVENTGGMVKLQNIFDEFLSAYYPYFLDIYNKTLVVSTDVYTECDYHFLWRVEAASEGLFYLVHNSTNLYFNIQYSDNIRVHVPWLEPTSDKVFEFVCSG